MSQYLVKHHLWSSIIVTEQNNSTSGKGFRPQPNCLFHEQVNITSLKQGNRTGVVNREMEQNKTKFCATRRKWRCRTIILKSTKFINGLFLDINWKYTYSSNFAQIASATLSIISDPSKNTESQIFKTVWLGRHVANRVRNHCIVKTFVSGGSYPPETEKGQENNRLLSLLHILTQK